MNTPPQPLTPATAKAFEGIQQMWRSEHPLLTQFHPEVQHLSRGAITVVLTPTERFLDDTVIHSGLMTILLDTIMGLATWSALEAFEAIATINLQTDTHDHAEPGKAIQCEARCEGIKDNVSIVRGRVHMAEGRLLAMGAGTFMVGTKSARVSRL